MKMTRVALLLCLTILVALTEGNALDLKFESNRYPACSSRGERYRPNKALFIHRIAPVSLPVYPLGSGLYSS